MLADHESGRLRIVAAMGLPAGVVGRVLQPARRRISDWVFHENRPLVLNGEIRDDRFQSSAEGASIESALCVPLPSGVGPIGVLNLARGEPGLVFGPADVEAVERQAQTLAGTLERLQERALAEKARLELLAAVGGTSAVRTEVLQAGPYQMAVCHAASRSVASDSWDRVGHAQGDQSVMMADVTGDGPVAMRDAAFARGLFVAFSEISRHPSRVGASLNRELHGRLGPDRPATAWLAHLALNGGLTSCNAGYPAPLWIPVEGGDPKPLDTGGLALGTDPDSTYEQEFIRMLPGDLIVAASDAVLRAPESGGEEFGLGRLSELATEQRRQPVEAVAEALCRSARAFAGGPWPPDDLLVFALRFVRDA